MGLFFQKGAETENGRYPDADKKTILFLTAKPEIYRDAD